MNVLIIGGSGNLSFETTSHLVEQGHRVTTLTRGNKALPKGSIPLIGDRNCLHEIEHKTQGSQFDVVINFLGFTPEQCHIDYQLFRGKIGQYIFISSATVYQKPPTHLPITEETPLSNPYSEYARNKIACENYLRSIESPEFPVTIIRPSHTFGKSWIPNQLNGSSDFTIAARILAGKPIVAADNGRALWTLTTAFDFAVGIGAIIRNPRTIGQTFHLTSDQSLCWNEIYAQLGSALGKKAQIEYIPTKFLTSHFPQLIPRIQGDKGWSTTFDNSKLRSYLPDFRCNKSFAEAIGESIAWFMADPKRRAINEEQNQMIDTWIALWKQKG